MLELKLENSFQRDYKLALKQGLLTKNVVEALEKVIDILRTTQDLPAKPYKPHL